MKKILVLIMALLFAVTSLTFIGCSEEEVVDDNILLFNDFEDYDKNVQNIKVMNGFGAVNHNSNKDYVKSGERSIQLRPNGWDFCTDNPFIILPTFSVKYEYGYTDFTNVERISMSVYNAEDKPLNMGVGLTTANVKTYQWYDNVTKLNPDWYVLQPGWNDISYYIQPNYFSMNQDFNIKEIYGVYLEFDYVGARSIEDTPTVYVDDVRFHNLDGERQNDTITLKSDATNGVWEICDFEDLMQSNFIYIRNELTVARFDLPSVKVVSAQKHGIVAKSGNNLLEITKRAGSGTGIRYLYVETGAMQKAFENVGKDKIASNPADYYIEFDLYNASSVEDSWSIEFYTDNGNSAKTWTSAKAKPGEWTTVSCSIKAIDDTLEARREKDLAREATDPERITQEEYDNYQFFKTNPGRFRLGFGNELVNEGVQNKTWLMDNCRIVYRPAEVNE